jgi:hypothetical protein
MRLHAFPLLGNRYLAEVQPSTIQGWLRTLGDLAGIPQGHVANVSTIFTAAVDDELIPKNPCKAPPCASHDPIPRSSFRGAESESSPFATSSPSATSSLCGSERASACGRARSSPSPHDIDFEAGEVHVRRQVRLFSSNRHVFGLPKARKTRKVATA